MTNSDLKASDSVSQLTVAELESLVTQIVQKLLQPETSSYDAMIQQIKQKLAEPYDHTAPSFIDIVNELAAQVPETEWANLPKDASQRYKDYL